LESIQRREVRSSRDMAMRLLGWLTFAKQPLKWREIQTMKSFDSKNYSFDLEQRQFLVHPKDICESLVEMRDDGTVELVHLSARE
jgi:hypothetical protein